MKQSIWILMLVFLATSCAKKEKELPINEEKLILVLSDMHLAEGAIQNLPKSAKDTLSYQYYEQIYAIHDITKEELYSCLSIMERNPKKLELVYKKVKTHIEDKAKEHTKEEKRKR